MLKLYMTIPRLTHQIWFQGWDQLPEKYHEDCEKLSILNQNWEHKKWDERSLRVECEKFSSEALAKFNSFKHMIQKIDFGRYIILYNYGGVSVDCDAECIRPLDKIPGLNKYDLIIGKNSLNKMENKVCSYGLSNNLSIVNNATLCCSKENPIMKHLIEFLIENESWNEDPGFDTQLRTGPLILSIFFNNYIDHPEVSIVDSEIFEPWGNITKRTIINHKYAQSWTDYGSFPVKLYSLIKSNLVLILVLVVIIVAFLIIRKLLAKSGL